MSAVSHLVFIDSGVLIAAARGVDPVAERALAILGNAALRFASSPFVRLEVLPKAHFLSRTAEVSFYQAFFEKVEVWSSVDATVVGRWRRRRTVACICCIAWGRIFCHNRGKIETDSQN
jgi:predicted nucleic acid-binding protein